MNPRDHIPALQAAARSVLPGMKRSRALLDATIRILEYFATYAADDAANGTATRFGPVEPCLAEQLKELKAMLSAFGRLHGHSS